MKADRRYLLLWLLLLGGCASFEGGLFNQAVQENKEAVRLEAILLEAPDLAGSALEVTIKQDRIVLDGFVETVSQRQRAEDLVRQNSDITSVTNRITVK